MKARMSIKNIIIIMATICLASMFFINICFAGNTGKITTETARLREQPQTDSKVLELASIGEEVEILEEVDEWYKVKYKNITGYIRKDLIEVKNKEEVNTTEASENTQIENTTSETENSNTETENIAKNEKVKVLEDIKLKIIPLISSIELNEVKQNTEVEIVETLNDWIKVRTTDGKEGWMTRRITTSTGETKVLVGLIEDNNNTTENTTTPTTTTQTTEQTAETQQTTQTKTMYVNSQTINVREKADKTSKTIKQLTINTQVTVISSNNGWAYVDINGTKGYISETLLSSTKQETSRSMLTEIATTAEKSTEKATTTETTTKNKEEDKTSSNSLNGSSVIAYAKQFLGCKYVYGGTTTSGFDCSGFTQFVYKHFGVTLNRTAAAQYSNGAAVTDLQAGDLVMFGKSGINHVGIYIGGNTFIHAANPSRGVTTDTLASGYYKTNYVGARRIF